MLGRESFPFWGPVPFQGQTLELQGSTFQVENSKKVCGKCRKWWAALQDGVPLKLRKPPNWNWYLRLKSNHHIKGHSVVPTQAMHYQGETTESYHTCLILWGVIRWKLNMTIWLKVHHFQINIQIFIQGNCYISWSWSKNPAFQVLSYLRVRLLLFAIQIFQGFQGCMLLANPPKSIPSRGFNLQNLSLEKEHHLPKLPFFWCESKRTPPPNSPGNKALHGLTKGQLRGLWWLGMYP